MAPSRCAVCLGAMKLGLVEPYSGDDTLELRAYACAWTFSNLQREHRRHLIDEFSSTSSAGNSCPRRLPEVVAFFAVKFWGVDDALARNASLENGRLGFSLRKITPKQAHLLNETHSKQRASCRIQRRWTTPIRAFAEKKTQATI
jgi:hypothetical protein